MEHLTKVEGIAKNPSTGIKRYLKVPHTYVLLLILILITTVFTYIIPAGEFTKIKDHASGKTVIKPDSFHSVAQHAINPIQIPDMIVKGLNNASDTILFIFIIGGAFQIITATGVMDVITAKIAKVFGNKEKLVIPVFLALFSIGGFTMGMSTEVMVFVPLGITIARSLGYDAITGTAMIALGAANGFTAGLMNPFNVGIAQAIAEIPLFSGMWLRAVLLVVLLIVTSLYIIRYAGKVKRNPSQSIVIDLEQSQTSSAVNISELPKFEFKHYLVTLTLILGFASLIWGVSKKGWYIEELSALFLAMGIVSGALAKFSPSRIASEFVIGAKAITFGALIVGIARTILVILDQGHVTDSIVNGMSIAVNHLPHSIQVLGMYIVQIIIHCFIVSGTGHAATTMPIMVPLSDLLGISRQTAVLVFQLGDGLTTSILPTSAAVMGYLSVSGIPFEKWFKFMLPLVGIWLVIGAVFIELAAVIHY